jgi:hypothetical protein
MNFFGYLLVLVMKFFSEALIIGMILPQYCKERITWEALEGPSPAAAAGGGRAGGVEWEVLPSSTLGPKPGG